MSANTITEKWEMPSPLGRQAELRPFPVDALPSWVTAEVLALGDFTQTPYDLAGTVALAVLSAAAGGRAVVEVRGSWREPLNLFLVSAMPPGSRKSAVFAELTGPLLETEQALIEVVRPQILEAETQQKIAQRNAERATGKASGIDDAEAAKKLTAEAISAAQMAEAITIPAMPRFVADDVTPEATASLLAEHGGRLAVLSAEGGIFATIAGRYSGTPSMEVFLKGHAGDMLRVDRKGRPPEHVPHPALTLGLCLQPEVLRDIAKLPGFRGRGLLARILYSLPPNTVGRRKIGMPPVPDDVRNTYGESVRQLVMTMNEWTDPAVLTLTPKAAQLVLDAEIALEPRLDPDTGDLAGIVDWASKQIGAVVRIAGLLHLADNLTNGWAQPIQAETMRRAIKIGDYFTGHAQATFDAMGVDPVLEDARALHRWIERTGPAQFTKRQMHMGVSRSRFPKVGDLDAPLDLLEEHGFIRRAPEPERTGPGRRPSPTYLVHPDLATETT
jgi:replicative DNA helicase